MGERADVHIRAVSFATPATTDDEEEEAEDPASAAVAADALATPSRTGANPHDANDDSCTRPSSTIPSCAAALLLLFVAATPTSRRIVVILSGMHPACRVVGAPEVVPTRCIFRIIIIILLLPVRPGWCVVPIVLALIVLIIIIFVVVVVVVVLEFVRACASR
jgi:hypothetical protein